MKKTSMTVRELKEMVRGMVKEAVQKQITAESTVLTMNEVMAKIKESKTVNEAKSWIQKFEAQTKK